MSEQDMMTNQDNLEVREFLSNPAFLRSIGAAWRLVFFLLLQVDISTKSYSASPDLMAEGLGVTVGTLSAWIQRLQALKVLDVRATTDRIKLALLPPLSKLTLVTEEGGAVQQKSIEPKRREGFDESTTDIILRRRTSAMNKVEEDIDFIFNKLQSFELRLSALEGSFLTHHQQASNKDK